MYLNNFALSETSGKINFYASPMDADSSLIKPLTKSHQIEVQVKTLNEYIQRRNINGSILLKMDAEGAEPEVLRGILHSVSKFKWMAIDVGPENQGKDTILEVTSILSELGFQIMHFENWILHARK